MNEPKASDDLVLCLTHGHASEKWVTCVHTDQIRVARKVAGQEPLTGEAVCEECRRALDEHRLGAEMLRLACGACVRENWPIEDAS